MSSANLLTQVELTLLFLINSDEPIFITIFLESFNIILILVIIH